jgi:Arylsulfotransferase (ASST)
MPYSLPRRSATLFVAMSLFLLGCHDQSAGLTGTSSGLARADSSDGGSADAGPEGAPGSDGTDAANGSRFHYVGVEGGAPVLSVLVTPGPLTPAFSPSIEDYYVRCSAGQNQLSVDATTTDGAESFDVTAAEGDAVVLQGQYWIRCLPHDFPVITVTTNPDAGGPTPGWYLVDNAPFVAVLDTNGTPVWYDRAAYAMNVDALIANTISFYQATSSGPFGTSDSDTFTLDPLGATSTPLQAVGGSTDGHELRLLPNGDHLLFTYLLEAGVDLTGLESFGSNETMVDGEIEEIAPNGTLVWSWRASDHVDPVRESIEPAVDVVNGTSVVDTFHLNSIDVDTQGNLLVSSRHTNAVFYVDRSSGKVLWKLGGSAYSKDGAALIAVIGDPEGGFNMQHDARLQPNGDVSLFDDHGATSGVARGAEYAIDFDSGTATLAFQFQGIAQSGYEGSFRRYPDGESVIGWGYIAADPRVVTEIDSDGEDVLDIAFSGGQPSYRAIKVPLAQLDAQLLRTTAGP